MPSTMLLRRAAFAILLAAAISDAYTPRFLSSLSNHGGRCHGTIRPALVSSSPTSSSVYCPQTALHAVPQSSTLSATRSPAQEFARQELLALLDAKGVLSNSKLLPTALNVQQRREVRNLVEKLTDNERARTATGKDNGSSSPQGLIGSSWVLCACTYDDSTTAGGANNNDAALPMGTTVQIDFDSPTKLLYSLVFPARAAGLERITATCDYEISSDTGSGKDNTIVAFTYKKVAFDAFGFLKQFPVGLFGLLQGRGNALRTKYWDDALWIEQSTNDSGERVYYNIYVRLQQQ